MDSQYWKDKWKAGDIGFHRENPHPRLVECFSKLQPRRVMVPLCGKSKDLVWLRAQGHAVVGIELSSLACESFFEENAIAFTKHAFGERTVYRGDRIEIWCMDFFKAPAAAWEGCTAVYDRAALIALPPEIRRKYAQHLTEAWKRDAAGESFILLIVGEYKSPQMIGPPFPVTEEEVNAYYGAGFDIQLLHSERDSALSGRPPKFTQIEVTERTYFLATH
jgi:thiopurine S-methyltransferase